MKRPAVFFDRDNTLIVNEGYLGDPSKVVLVDGAAEAVARVRSLGYAVVAFSNQSGVARGMFGEEDVHRVNQRIDELLADAHPQAVIDRHEFCPFHPEGTIPQYAVESDLRKPKPGMIFQAAQKLALDLSRSWVIGDAPRDIESGKAGGCRTIWYKDTRLPQSMSARELMLTVPDAVVSSLKEATDVIAREALMRQAAPPEVNSGSPATQPLGKPEEVEQEPLQRTDELAASNRSKSVPSASASDSSEETPETAISEAEHREDRRTPGPKSVSTAKPLMQVLAQKRSAAESPQVHNPGDPAVSSARLEELAEQILQELQRKARAAEGDFSISKLLAGIMQIIALAVLALAFLIYQKNFQSVALVAVFLQTFTIALLIMGRQRS